MKNTSSANVQSLYPILKHYADWSTLDQYNLEFIERYSVLKVSEDESSVVVATPQGDESPGLRGKLVNYHSPKSLHIVDVDPADFKTALARLFSRIDETGLMNAGGSETAMLDRISSDAPTINLVNSVILEAVRLKASDIHIEKDDKNMTVRYRVDGLLRTASVHPTDRFASVSSRVKLMANLNIMETRKPQDGRLTVSLEGRDIHMRLSVVPLIRGESLVLRLFYREEDIINPSQLGFADSVVESIRNLFALPHGLILTTGPTGSGKTTTLNAFLTEIKDERKKIITLEDPVEYIIPGIDQIQVNEDVDLTFDVLLRRVLRQDPDVIMVGEIRDQETASLAIRAALTGHLVLATLHTNNAPAAVTRLVDLGIPSYLIGAVLRGVLAQRLVRRLCKKCGELSHIDTVGRALAQLHNVEIERVGSAVGCPECEQRGYIGRTAISEWFTVNEALGEIIAGEAANSQRIRDYLAEKGFQSLIQDAFSKAAAGITTIEEIRRAVVG